MTVRPPPPSDEDIVVPFRAAPSTLGVATHVRSTLLVSSLQSLRKRGLEADYLERLPPQHHMAIRSMIAGQWAPMPLALAHYEACDALGMSVAEARAMGREVGERVEGTFLATMVRMAGKVGATPWTALSRTGRLYERLLDGGGGVTVLRRGPKDARAAFVGFPLARVPYFRAAMLGVFEVAAEIFCTKAVAREVPEHTTGTNVSVDVAWA